MVAWSKLFQTPLETEIRIVYFSLALEEFGDCRASEDTGIVWSDLGLYRVLQQDPGQDATCSRGDDWKLHYFLLHIDTPGTLLPTTTGCLQSQDDIDPNIATFWRNQFWAQSSPVELFLLKLHTELVCSDH
ncbi:hypothetical protein llap_9587 [Limosa lapponica baueri]|uniref:Uncharacterized protein n=1 Tax=Limosa lapponica baueri TaxID=1758121 RepID=A0A2I0U257_LIMLA|nr:hypothetical protein llap_9587 [Limosa lapponica baueri]